MTTASALAVAHAAQSAFPPARRKELLPNHPPCCSQLVPFPAKSFPSKEEQDSKRARPCQGQVLPVLQEIPNPTLNYPTSTTTRRHHLDFSGNTNPSQDPVILYFPKSSISTLLYSLLTRTRTAAKGDPRQMWIPAHGGGESQRHGKKGEERSRRRKEGACEQHKSTKKPSSVMLGAHRPAWFQAQMATVGNPAIRRRSWMCLCSASAMECYQIPHGTSSVTWQDTGLEVNGEESDTSLQDRLQESGHTAPEGES